MPGIKTRNSACKYSMSVYEMLCKHTQNTGSRRSADGTAIVHGCNTVSAHVMEKRECPQCSRATPSQGAMRQTSHVADTAAALTVAVEVIAAGGSTTADWSLARSSVTGVIFVVAVSTRSSMKCLGVRAQTVADCPQKLKTAVGAVVIAFDT